MNKALLLCVLAAGMCLGQPADAGLLLRTQELQSSIDAGDWNKAAEVSTSLRNDIIAARNHSLSASATSFVDTFLTWLPANTETFVVAQQPFTLATEAREEFPSALKAAHGYVLGLLAASEKRTLLKALDNRTIAFAALAARNFHRPPPIQQNGRNIMPLGMIAYEGCAVYNFAEPLPESLLPREPEDTLLGYRVWTSKGSQNDARDSDTYFVSILEPRMIAACNDRAFLLELITRKGQPQQPRAMPPQLPEWQLVDRTAALWAVSHYTPNAMAPEGTGVGFSYSPPGAITARVISPSDPWKIAESPDFENAAKSRKVADNVWELSVSENAQAGAFATFVLMAFIGFVVLI